MNNDRRDSRPPGPRCRGIPGEKPKNFKLALKKLIKYLKEYTKTATSIIVASRVGTIKNADKIIVLDKGKCVGIGTHKELLKNCEVYKEIALSQLSKEELEHAW